MAILNLALIWITSFALVSSSSFTDRTPTHCPLPEQRNRKLINIECEYSDNAFTIENVTETETVPPSCALIIGCNSQFGGNHANHFKFLCKTDGKWFPGQPQCRMCGVPNAGLRPLMARGTNEIFGNTPWHIAIYDRKLNYTLICGGTIVTEYMVLTAAHCVYDLDTLEPKDPKHFLIATAKITRNISVSDNQFQEFYEIKQIRVPPSGFYGLKTNFATDIALLLTERRIKFSNAVLPACIDWTSQDFNPLPNEYGKVVGWGKTETGIVNNALQTTELRFIDYTHCIQHIPIDYKSTLTLDKFCAINEANKSSVQSGDSGGGLTFRHPFSSLFYVRGIVSTNILSSGLESPSFFTDVSKYVDWIREVKVNNECSLQNRTTCSTGNCPIPEATSTRYFDLHECSSQINAPTDPPNLYKEIPHSCALTAKCRSGFAFSKRSVTGIRSVCENGEWIPPIRDCQKACKKLHSEDMEFTCYMGNYKTDCNVTDVPVGTRVVPYCKWDYRPDTANYTDIVCMENGEWNHPLFKCIPDKCERTKEFHSDLYANRTCHLNNRLISCDQYIAAGTKVKFSCVSNYGLDVPYDTVTCEPGGLWSKNIPKCEKDYCPRFNSTAFQNINIKCKYWDNDEDCNVYFKYGSRIQLACKPGYHPDSMLRTNNFNKLVCDKDGRWNSPVFKCVKDKCSRFNLESTANITCKLKGKLVNCSDPIVRGTEVSIPCNGTYTGTYQQLWNVYKSKCQADGTWTVPNVDCSPLTDIGVCKRISINNVKNSGIACYVGNKIINCNREMFPVNTRVSVRCIHGYRPVQIRDGAFQKNATDLTVFPLTYWTQCQPNGQWSRRVPDILGCIKDECERFTKYPEPKKGLKVSCKYNNREANCSHPIMAGTEMKLDCVPGFHLHPDQQNDTVVCGINAKWNTEVYGCEKVLGQCKLTAQFDKTYLAVTCERNNKQIPCTKNVAPGTNVKMSCSNNLRLNEDYDTITCQPNGQWDRTTPKCDQDYCRRLNFSSLENMHITCQKNHVPSRCENSVSYNTEVVLQCAPGYWPDSVLVTNTVQKIICDRDGSWSAPAFKCIKDKCKRFAFEGLNATCSLDGHLISCDEDIVEGTEVTLPCDFNDESGADNYTTICRSNGFWSVPKSKCTPLTINKCVKLPSNEQTKNSKTKCILEGKVINCNQEEFLPGTKLITGCISGYRPVEIQETPYQYYKKATAQTIFPVSYTTECQLNGQWTRRIPEILSCQKDECKRLSEFSDPKYNLYPVCRLNNEEISCNEKIVVGTEVKLDCNPGYYLHPDEQYDTVYCQPNAMWSKTGLYGCSEDQCERFDFGAFRNMNIVCKYASKMVHCSRAFKFGTSIEFACATGFIATPSWQVNESHTIHCYDDKSAWTVPKFTCVKKTATIRADKT